MRGEIARDRVRRTLEANAQAGPRIVWLEMHALAGEVATLQLAEISELARTGCTSAKRLMCRN